MPWPAFEGTKTSLKGTEVHDLVVRLESLQKELCWLIYKYPPVIIETTIYFMSLMGIDSKIFNKFSGNTKKTLIRHVIHHDLMAVHLKYKDSES